jgi:enoyl-CoA hydratase/carnithine racemase
LEEALRFEADAQAELMEHPNFREAYEAFGAKREPKFR